MYRIDKTEGLDNRLARVPSVYIEGAAASGKTMAVEMLLEKYEGVKAHTFDVGDTREWSVLDDKLCKLESNDKLTWLIFENIPADLPKEVEGAILKRAMNMPESWKAIFISREQPSAAFLDMLWKGKMEILPQKELLFNQREIQRLIAKKHSTLQSRAMLKTTGGWPGCVSLMVHMTGNSREGSYENVKITAEELRNKYEIDTYVRQEILAKLSNEEQRIVAYGKYCPWISPKLCEDFLGLGGMKDILVGMERKGILTSLPMMDRWVVAPLFNDIHESDFPWKSKLHGSREPFPGDSVALSNWFEEAGCIREAMWVIKNYGATEQLQEFLLKHYDQIAYCGMPFDEVLKIKENIPEIRYLKGMCYLQQGNLEKVAHEARRIGKDRPELYLNLTFNNPKLTLDQWLEEVDQIVKKQEKAGAPTDFRLYDVLGYNHTYLCGVRDLTGLFACGKKEENQKANLWKKAFDEEGWQAYCMARADYYIETDREKTLYEEDRQMVELYTSHGGQAKIDSTNWKSALAALYLLCRLETISSEPGRIDQIHQLKSALIATGDILCCRNAEAIMSLYGPMLGNPEQLNRWLMLMEGKTQTEKTGTEIMCQIRGYLTQRQYEKAEQLVQYTLGMSGRYHLHYFHAEALFQSAVISWHGELHGQALKSVIESFIIAGNSRYVLLYTHYGKPGVEVIKSYVEWMRNNASGSWNTKKKYNYGNVLRMPVEDYLDVILRKTKRSVPKDKSTREQSFPERLTMMETIMLIDISRGLTNADICAEQNLKLSTVKTHLYALYKKLGVKTRVQAVLKGKELGILK